MIVYGMCVNCRVQRSLMMQFGFVARSPKPRRNSGIGLGNGEIYVRGGLCYRCYRVRRKHGIDVFEGEEQYLGCSDDLHGGFADSEREYQSSLSPFERMLWLNLGLWESGRMSVDVPEYVRVPPFWQCAACEGVFAREVDSVSHHVSYFPERVVVVCRSCHGKIHRSEKYPLLRPPDGDSAKFYGRELTFSAFR